MSILQAKRDPIVTPGVQPDDGHPARNLPGTAPDPLSPKPQRRSGIDRRWIKAPYSGPERRRGGDRRDPQRPEGKNAIAYRFNIKLSPLHLKRAKPRDTQEV